MHVNAAQESQLPTVCSQWDFGIPNVRLNGIGEEQDGEEEGGEYLTIQIWSKALLKGSQPSIHL